MYKWEGHEYKKEEDMQAVKFRGSMKLGEFLDRFGKDLTQAAIATLNRMKFEGRLW